VSLRAAVREALAAHGVRAAPDETPQALRERLNDVYLDEVRALKARQRSGEIPLREYAAHVEALKARFPLLALPLSSWEE
jgi:hypothetical protein